MILLSQLQENSFNSLAVADFVQTSFLTETSLISILEKKQCSSRSQINKSDYASSFSKQQIEHYSTFKLSGLWPLKKKIIQLLALLYGTFGENMK